MAYTATPTPITLDDSKYFALTGPTTACPIETIWKKAIEPTPEIVYTSMLNTPSGSLTFPQSAVPVYGKTSYSYVFVTRSQTISNPYTLTVLICGKETLSAKDASGAVSIVGTLGGAALSTLMSSLIIFDATDP